jgi:predicted dehydrogenase
VGVYDTHEAVDWPRGVLVLAGEAEAIARAEVLVVATPIPAHAGTVGRALAAGLHVLVEKPLCTRAHEADALVAAARGPARLFVGHSERFNPVVRALTKLVGDERVVAIDLQRIGATRPTDCGVLVNLAVHDLDLAAYLSGGQVTVHGAVGGPAGGASGEDVAHVLLTTTSGAFGHVYVDRTTLERRRGITLVTRHWIYEGDLLGHRLLRSPRGTRARAPRTEVPLLLEEPLVAQALALADALDGASPREIATGVDGARAVALAEQAAAHCASTDSAEKLSIRVPR